MGLADDQVVGFNVDSAVMMANLRTGVASVHPRLGELVEARPRTKVPWILSMANLGHAIECAVANCNTAPAVSRAELDAKYAELRKCGVELFGEDEVDEKVPRLHRRVQVVTAPQNDNGGGEEPEPAPDA